MNANENLCRICLTTNVFFDWKEAIFEFSGPSYKECYYHYTHLHQEAKDLYTQMLCLDCGNGLRNAYILVDKAVASDLKLKNQKCEIIAVSPLQFEKEQLISVDMYNKEQVITSDMQSSHNATIGDSIKTNRKIKKEHNVLTETTFTENTEADELLDVNFSFIQDSVSASESDVNKSSNVINNSKLKRKKKTKTDSVSAFESDVNKSSNVINNSKPKRKKKTTLLCSYCPKTFNYRNHLFDHEKRHEQNRERTEVCTICGLKMYCKYALSAHMDIHNDNRERKHKCEFCPKAFFARGALNIHRRIHLGQMIKCNFCPKEFYRQIDVDRHMKSHNLMPITREIKPRVRSKYFRECDICGDKVNRDYWKHHKAKHLNQPTLQCSICSKKFFPCSRVQRHLKQCHGVASDEYHKFLIKLDDKFEPRLTRLMIEQKIMKVYTEI